MKIKHSARINLILYSLLLVATPFLMLQNYMQSSIGVLGRSSFSIATINVPYVLLIAIIFLLVIITLSWRYINKVRIVGFVTIFLMLMLGQHTSDYYFNHVFYDLQYNWHFIAYSIFSYLAYRYFKERNFSSEVIIRNTFIIALALSSFDEIVQVFISNRVFDMSDIAKDIWGCVIGQIFVQVLLLNAINFKIYRVRVDSLKNYSKHPFVLLVHQAILAYVFLYISSILTDPNYWVQVILFSLITYFIVLFIIHLGQTKISRWVIRVAVILISFWILFAVVKDKKHISVVSNNIMVYNGIPIYYFDVMVYPNGRFRLVDKKAVFRSRDKLKLDDMGADIILIATGSDNTGGKGFNDQVITELKYSISYKEVYQIIKLRNNEAVKLFNKLNREDKEVLLIFHNN